MIRSIFVFVKHNYINNPKSVRRKLSLSLFFQLLKYLLSVYWPCSILRIVSLEPRGEFTGNKELPGVIWLLDGDGCCSDHNTGSDPPPHARGLTNHQSREAAPHHSPWCHRGVLGGSDLSCVVTILFVVFTDSDWDILSVLALHCTLGMAREMARCCCCCSLLVSVLCALELLLRPGPGC